jgi:hypothetical protein
MEELVRKSQDQIKLLGTVLKDKDKTSPRKGKSVSAMSNKDMIRKLAHEGWTMEHIAQATGVSRGEIELILDLGQNE